MIIKAIIFDAFNTVIYRDRKYVSEPYKIVRDRATKPLINPMGRNINLREYADIIGASFSDKEWRKIEGDLAIELDHIHPYPKVKDLIIELNKRNLIVAIGSNLAPEYGPVVESIFGNLIDEYYFSFELEIQKPNPAFYRYIESDIVEAYDGMDASHSNEFVMVGDSFINDYLTPSKMGWRSFHLDHNFAYPSHENRIHDLSELLDKL